MVKPTGSMDSSPHSLGGGGSAAHGSHRRAEGGAGAAAAESSIADRPAGKGIGKVELDLRKLTLEQLENIQDHFGELSPEDVTSVNFEGNKNLPGPRKMLVLDNLLKRCPNITQMNVKDTGVSGLDNVNDFSKRKALYTALLPEQYTNYTMHSLIFHDTASLDFRVNLKHLPDLLKHAAEEKNLTLAGDIKSVCLSAPQDSGTVISKDNIKHLIKAFPNLDRVDVDNGRYEHADQIDNRDILLLDGREIQVWCKTF